MYRTLFNPIDIVAVPVAIIIVMLVASRIKKNQPQQVKRFFNPALYLRFFGSICITFIYQFVYGYGDTFAYYYHTQIISSFFTESVSGWWQILSSDPLSSNFYMQKCIDKIALIGEVNVYVFSDPENANVSKIGALFNFVCFDSYPAMAIFFGFFSFLGCWYIYRSFIKIFPGYEKQFALLCLFLPSLWFWGNGLLKDPLSIYGLGVLVFNVFASDKNYLRRILFCLWGAFILDNTKSYILGALAIAATAAFLLYYLKHTNFISRWISVFFIFGMLVVFSGRITEYIFSVFNQLIEQAQVFLKAYADGGDESSAILTSFEPTPYGLFTLSLKGLINVYLRPFPWELKKIVYLFSIMENLLLYYILFRKVPMSTFYSQKSKLFKNFCVFFFLILGIIVGVTTFNLGTISRYRVPGLPFLFGGIFLYKIIRGRVKAAKKKLIKEQIDLKHVPIT